jgi:hypothetical protein
VSNNRIAAPTRDMRPAAHRYHSHLNVCSPVIGASRDAAEIAEAKASLRHKRPLVDSPS